MVHKANLSEIDGIIETKATIAWLKSKGVWTIRLLASEQGNPIYQKMGSKAAKFSFLRVHRESTGNKQSLP